MIIAPYAKLKTIQWLMKKQKEDIEKYPEYREAIESVDFMSMSDTDIQWYFIHVFFTEENIVQEENWDWDLLAERDRILDDPEFLNYKREFKFTAKIKNNR